MKTIRFLKPESGKVARRKNPRPDEFRKLNLSEIRQTQPRPKALIREIKKSIKVYMTMPQILGVALTAIRNLLAKV